MCSEHELATRGDNLANLRELIKHSTKRDKNEAETRHKIIDFILHEFLSWPKNRVSVEEHIRPGFADYILRKENGINQIFIEAKKEGTFFSLPISHREGETFCYISLQKLMSDENIKTTVTQVRSYCIDVGCEFAGITNGFEWIFFKTFERGRRWDSSLAFVVRNLSFFDQEYTKAINSLSYLAITQNSSLTALLTSSPPKDRSIYYPKERIVTYSHTINANRLASALRPLPIRLTHSPTTCRVLPFP